MSGCVFLNKINYLDITDHHWMLKSQKKEQVRKKDYSGAAEKSLLRVECEVFITVMLHSL